VLEMQTRAGLVSQHEGEGNEDCISEAEDGLNGSVVAAEHSEKQDIMHLATIKLAAGLPFTTRCVLTGY